MSKEKINKLNKKYDICNGFKHSYEYVKEYFEIFGYILLSKTYENSLAYLEYKCANGHSSKTKFKRFVNGNRCKQCLADSLKMDIGIIRKEAKKRGHILLSKRYDKAKSPLKFKCDKGHIFVTNWDKYRSNPIRSKRSNGCQKCGHLKNSLSGNYNYKGHRTAK